MKTPVFKEIKRAYGFDEVAIVPGEVTINPELARTELILGNHSFSVPVLAAAMDAVVDPLFAVNYSRQGGLAVLNMEGLWTRYDNPAEILNTIVKASREEVTSLLQKFYTEPIKERLIGERVQAVKKAGGICAVSMIPQNTKKFWPLASEAGMDILVVQSTVTTAKHKSKSYKGLVFADLCEEVKKPVIVGNCVSYNVALELMESGVSGILVGVGPGAACTTREVLGIGVPQVTSTMDCAAAREEYLRRTGKYVNIITDGGIRNGGDLCKAVASGADAVMLGSIFAQAQEAPGKGFHWGMATYHSSLPRGTRIKVGVKGPLEQILFGPTSVTDGTQNLMGALRTAMGVCGAYTIRDMQKAQMVIAPAIKTEGKLYQLTQSM